MAKDKRSPQQIEFENRWGVKPGQKVTVTVQGGEERKGRYEYVIRDHVFMSPKTKIIRTSTIVNVRHGW